MADILYLIILFLIVIVVIVLIVVLIRLYMVLTDINDTTKITKRRARDLDKWIDKVEKSVRDISDMTKVFSDAFAQLKGLKEKISKYVDAKGTDKKED